jgi:hypothetical protein
MGTSSADLSSYSHWWCCLYTLYKVAYFYIFVVMPYLVTCLYNKWQAILNIWKKTKRLFCWELLWPSEIDTCRLHKCVVYTVSPKTWGDYMKFELKRYLYRRCLGIWLSPLPPPPSSPGHFDMSTKKTTEGEGRRELAQLGVLYSVYAEESVPAGLICTVMDGPFRLKR